MPTTDPTGHALLSAASAALETDDYGAFQQQVALAEDLLGVGLLTITGSDDLALATRAVVRQVNAQVAYEAASESGGSVLKREKKGDQEREWAVEAASAGSSSVPIDAIAQQLIQSLDVGSGWDTVTSLRG